MIYLKLLTIEDPRFTYRQHASSSSLASHTAALIAHYLQDYIKPNGQLLDPMCNDGTLLIERSLMMPPHFVMGLDFSAELMEKAKQKDQNRYNIYWGRNSILFRKQKYSKNIIFIAFII